MDTSQQRFRNEERSLRRKPLDRLSRIFSALKQRFVTIFLLFSAVLFLTLSQAPAAPAAAPETPASPVVTPSASPEATASPAAPEATASPGAPTASPTTTAAPTTPTPSPSASPASTPSEAPADKKTGPKTCRLGVYLLALRDFSPVEKTFGADFWAWSVCPSGDLKPLKSIEVINGANIQTAYDNEVAKKDIVGAFKDASKVTWAQQKIGATLRHNWNLSNFPFDRHILEIPLEESTLDTTGFVYTPDTEASTYKENMKIPGWKITSFQVKGRTTKYNSTFGDPELKTGESEYSRLSIFIGIRRDSTIGFFKLITGVYAAFATVLLAFFLEAGSDFGSRTGLLVGSLFAVLVSMQGLEGVLGNSAQFTMVDAIHVTALGYIILAVIAAVYSRILHERGRDEAALKFDRKICFSLFTISFSILNIVLVANALIRG